MRFSWDGRKSATNWRKHRVSFEEARTVFYDDHARIIADPDHSRGEERFVLLGCSYHARILAVVHCYRKPDETIRIISARKASRKEQRYYMECVR